LKNIRKTAIALLLAAVMPLTMTGCVIPGNASEKAESNTVVASKTTEKPAAAKSKLYALKYTGKPCVKVNRGLPSFSKSQLRTKSYEKYGKLDRLGRCTSCTANIGRDLMPKGKRGSIGMIKPTGWHTIRYSFVDGKYLYNRCHLIGYQLTGENANKRNLITGTRYMNVDGMEPFETEVAQYVRRTGHHVLYRVTPIFKGRELVARGVHMEAESVEDHGRGIRFNIYCYNVQPGVKINYATGNSTATNGESGTHGGSTPSHNSQLPGLESPGMRN
jgi:DNA-entry nuclease